MDADDHALAETADSAGEIDEFIARRREARHQKLSGRNRAALDRFLGSGRRAQEAAILPRYYGELLTWALERYMEREGWQALQTLGYLRSEPVYIDVSTGCGRRENLLMNGQVLAEKEGGRQRDGQDLHDRGLLNSGHLPDGLVNSGRLRDGCPNDDGRPANVSRLVITVEVNPQGLNSVLVEGPASRQEEVRAFAAGVMALAREQNFYRGGKLEFAGRLRFLDLAGRSWESIILEEGTRREIRANTIGFLARRESLTACGIAPRRGLLLAGEPGTGKTIICKALMAEADGLTCISANAYAMGEDGYLSELYDLAADLAPCIVFIEDIDLIGQNRDEFGYQKGPALVSLLSVLDGVEEKKDIVTVATTNCLETLDRALSQRPSRFDRVVKLARPGFEQRLELVERLSRRIPLGPGLRHRVAARTEGCTPAQVQEVVHSLVIEQAEEDLAAHVFSEAEVDRIVSRINGKTRHPLGFRALGGRGGQSAEAGGRGQDSTGGQGPADPGGQDLAPLPDDRQHPGNRPKK